MLPISFSYYRPTPDWYQTIWYVLFLSYAFLGLEDMAVQIQNPFGDSLSDLPLDIFIQIVQDDIEEVVRLKYEQYNDIFTDKLEGAVSNSGVRKRKKLKNERIYPNPLPEKKVVLHEEKM